jgi:hypothetical protein
VRSDRGSECKGGGERGILRWGMCELQGKVYERLNDRGGYGGLTPRRGERA